MTDVQAARTDAGRAVSGRGLDEAEAARRLAAEGRNDLPGRHGDGIVAAIGRQLADPTVVVLLVAAVLTAAVRDLPDMAVILMVIVLNTGLGVGQERRSARAIVALQDMTAPRATVVREGREREIDAREVVRGDLVRLRAGDIVPADLQLTDAAGLQFDESAMTGESMPADRGADEPALAGTVVTRGRGSGVVTAVGSQTALAGVARSVLSRPPRTPLQVQLSGLARRLALLVGLAAVVVAVLGLTAGRSVEVSLVIGLSLAVAAIPESLPAVVSLSLALGASRMAARGVLTRRLPAVEALGSVTVVATDKTGTLTTGTMAVTDLRPAGGRTSEELLRDAVLCNDVDLAGGEGTDRQDPTETALVAAAVLAGLDVARVRAEHARIAERPFDAAVAYMATTHRGPDGQVWQVAKGAPEAIARLLPGESPKRAPNAAADDMAAGGQRVLAVAERHGATADWEFVGLLGLTDPVRPEAAGFVTAFADAGVRTVMITGDHAATASTVARAVGIAADDVHPRTRPDRKADIVADLQRQGAVVAMTGDGVNDAPALRRADVGVAMGRRGTEVAKQAADLVLTGDDLSALRDAIAEGRRVYDNVRRFLRYALAGGVAEVLVMLLGPLAGFAVPLGAGQILWVNLLTHGLPGVAMGNEPAEPDVLRRPPRAPNQPLLDAAVAWSVAALASLVTAACLVVAVVVHERVGAWQSALFLTLALSQLAIALALRPRQVRVGSNVALPGAVALNVVLALLGVYWAPLRDVLDTRPVRAADLAVAVVAACLVGCIVKVTGTVAHVLASRRVQR